MSANERRSPLLPLRNEAYRRIWLASISSNLGGLIQGVGAAWMMASISTSENMVALVQASNTGPIMLLSLIAGAIADSFDRRKVMIAAQLFMIVVSALLTLFALLRSHHALGTPCLHFLIGCGTALNNPSWQASVGDIVPRADLPAPCR